MFGTFLLFIRFAKLCPVAAFVITLLELISSLGSLRCAAAEWPTMFRSPVVSVLNCEPSTVSGPLMPFSFYSLISYVLE